MLTWQDISWSIFRRWKYETWRCSDRKYGAHSVLGDPVEITVRGYELSVRKADAACVEVVEVRK